MPNQTSEQRARETIDVMLAASGWSVQAKDAVNLGAARGVAVCELSFATGAPDYTLFVDCKAIGTVEAKPAGVTLASVEEQSAKYVAPRLSASRAVPTTNWSSATRPTSTSSGSRTQFTTIAEELKQL